MNKARMIRSGMTKNATTQGIDKQQCELDRAVLRMRGALMVAAGDSPRHFGKNDCACGNADHADRQLIDPVGVIKRRKRACRQKACDDRVGE